LGKVLYKGKCQNVAPWFPNASCVANATSRCRHCSSWRSAVRSLGRAVHRRSVLHGVGRSALTAVPRVTDRSLHRRSGARWDRSALTSIPRDTGRAVHRRSGVRWDRSALPPVPRRHRATGPTVPPAPRCHGAGEEVTDKVSDSKTYQNSANSGIRPRLA